MGCDVESDCAIWYISGIGQEPSIKIGCGHIFHIRCLLRKIKRRWGGPRINMLYKECPSWKQDIVADHHPEIKEIITEALDLEKKIKQKAEERGRYEGLIKEDQKEVDDHTVNDLIKKMSFYQCYTCRNPYFGGMQECGDNVDDNDNFNEKELVWGSWVAAKLGGQTHCETHGNDYIEYKCRYWCNYARWFCHGDTHYCEPCHSSGNRTPKPCPGPPSWMISNLLREFRYLFIS